MSQGPHDIWYWVDIFYIVLKTDILQIRLLHDSQHDSSDTLVTENQHGGCWWPGAYLKPCHLQPLCGRSPVFTEHEWSSVNSKHNTRNEDIAARSYVLIYFSMVSQITSLTIVYSTVYPDADHRKHQSSASLPIVRGIHRWPVNSGHKGPVTRKCFHLMTSLWCP